MGPSSGAPGSNEVLVAAIKLELLQQYEEVFVGCDLTPTFTLAALARPWACAPASNPPSTPATYLDIGRTSAELLTLRGGAPVAIRTLPFGGDTITSALQTRLGLPRAEAEKLKLDLHDPAAPVADAAARDAARTVIATEVAAFAASLEPGWSQGPLRLTGGSARLEGLPEALARSIGAGATCERVQLESGEGRSAAILGLRARLQQTGDDPPLVLRRPAPGTAATRQARNATANSWRWAALAAALAVACVALRFVEPVFGLGALNRRIAELRERQARLPSIDRDLAFLQHVRTNQPPYLDLVHTLAEASPPGTRLNSIALSRRGDLSVRATLRNSEEVIAFRSKLDGSARFASVVVDEQTPSPDQQSITVRITGQSATLLARDARPGSSASPTGPVPPPGPGPQPAGAPVPPPSATALAGQPGQPATQVPRAANVVPTNAPAQRLARPE